MKALEPFPIPGITFRNRILRSATYEGLCDERGFAGMRYADFYENLARMGAGGIITGFAFISADGRAMQPGQAGIDSADKIPGLRVMTGHVHRYDCPVILQIAHAGRQTLSRVTGMKTRGCSRGRSVYFGERPIPLSEREIHAVARQFGLSAAFAREAGFDGVQLHAAHGYLVHQFLLRGVNRRHDAYGIDPQTGIGSAFPELVIREIRQQCGTDFPLLVKVSGGINDERRFGEDHFQALVATLDRAQVDAIEVSYGTMDYPFNIFRGELPVTAILARNPIFRTRSPLRRYIRKKMIDLWFRPRLLPYSPVYNLPYARIAKSLTGIPVISVGGFRTGQEIEDAIAGGSADLVSLSRPFVAEPDYILKLISDHEHRSSCIQCNLCAVMCDTGEPTKCYQHQSQ